MKKLDALNEQIKSIKNEGIGKFKKITPELPNWEDMIAISMPLVKPDNYVVITNMTFPMAKSIYKSYNDEANSGKFNGNFDDYVNETTSYFAVSARDITKKAKLEALMQVDIITSVLTIIHLWKHRNDKPWDASNQPQPNINIETQIDLQCTRNTNENQ